MGVDVLARKVAIALHQLLENGCSLGFPRVGVRKTPTCARARAEARGAISASTTAAGPKGQFTVGCGDLGDKRCGRQIDREVPHQRMAASPSLQVLKQAMHEVVQVGVLDRFGRLLQQGGRDDHGAPRGSDATRESIASVPRAGGRRSLR